MSLRTGVNAVYYAVIYPPAFFHPHNILITNALPKTAFCLAICGLLRRRRRQNGARFAAYEASSAVHAHGVMTTNGAYALAPGEAPPRPPLHLIYINKD